MFRYFLFYIFVYGAMCFPCLPEEEKTHCCKNPKYNIFCCQKLKIRFFCHNVAKYIYTIWIATLIPIPTCFANKTVEYSDLIENRYLSWVSWWLVLQVKVAFPKTWLLCLHNQVVLRNLSGLVRQTCELFQFLVFHLWKSANTTEMLLLVKRRYCFQIYLDIIRLQDLHEILEPHLGKSFHGFSFKKPLTLPLALSSALSRISLKAFSARRADACFITDIILTGLDKMLIYCKRVQGISNCFIVAPQSSLFTPNIAKIAKLP